MPYLCNLCKIQLIKFLQATRQVHGTAVVKRHQSLSPHCSKVDKTQEYDASALGSFLRTHAPLLKRLKIPSGCDASLLHALPPGQLEELLISGLERSHVNAIVGFANLTKVTTGRVESGAEFARALSKLTRLRELCCFSLSVEESSALPQSLQVLDMKSLNLGNLSVLTTLLDRIVTRSLPACKTICIRDMEFNVGTYRENASVRGPMCNGFARIPQLLAALPHVRVEIGVYNVFGHIDWRDTVVWSPCQLFPSICEMAFCEGSVTSQDIYEIARLPHLKSESIL